MAKNKINGRSLGIMKTYHIHIGGLVQGVGFRPFVFRTAHDMKINGKVSNEKNGVHIWFNATNNDCDKFYSKLINNAPLNAVITNHRCEEVESLSFDQFSISTSSNIVEADLLFTPDLSICPSCKSELKDLENRRYNYPFITCLECGPRYSITKSLPYDRERTTMAHFKMCTACQTEYQSITDKRNYSQTNSCPNCAINLLFYNKDGELISKNTEVILELINNALLKGQIIAVKGVGGYLLMCDAEKKLSISLLRERKKRPNKPFAILYPNINKLSKDLEINELEKKALESKVAPIVVCKAKEKLASNICLELISPGIKSVGAMLPYTGLLELIASTFNKPLIATSGNLSGSPIIHLDDDAILYLGEFADFIISYNRDITIPQDDSLLKFTRIQNRKIVLRRSRGMAPNYFPNPFCYNSIALAMGGELKSSFAINYNKKLYISQFLGDQSVYESQLSYEKTLSHLLQLIEGEPSEILIDSHPAYHTAALGKELASTWHLPVKTIQHHKAHFAAVLAENNQLNNNKKILGVIWDGTGFGDDAQIWGGEFFIKTPDGIQRAFHMKYFPQLLGDKMSKEPRLSAVSLLHENYNELKIVADLFTSKERDFIMKLLSQPIQLFTSSMGRLLDGIAAILKICAFNSYEGEGAMKLETMAAQYKEPIQQPYTITIKESEVDWSILISQIIHDCNNKKPKEFIAKKIFLSLAWLIHEVASTSEADAIAFSGGVFQNAILVDMIDEVIGDEFELFYHREISPNDECIGFGQLAFNELSKNITQTKTKNQLLLNH
jgi:hydrogenase maturation protein HypF